MAHIIITRGTPGISAPNTRETYAADAHTTCRYNFVPTTTTTTDRSLELSRLLCRALARPSLRHQSSECDSATRLCDRGAGANWRSRICVDTVIGLCALGSGGETATATATGDCGRE